MTGRSVREEREFLSSELGSYAVHVVEYETENKYGLTNPPAERIVLALRAAGLLRDPWQ